MDHRQEQRRISLLLSDRRQDTDPAIADLEDCLPWIAISVADFDAMQTLDLDPGHFVGDRVAHRRPAG
jgi:hypothetical protein